MNAENLNRRKIDQESHKEIMCSLKELNDGQIKIGETQKHIIGRLDKINGTVADYNERKHKIDEAHIKVTTLEAHTVKTSQLLAETALINKNILLQKDLEAQKAHTEICNHVDKNYVSKKTLKTMMNTMVGLGTFFGLIVTFLAIVTTLKSCGIPLGG